MSDYRDKSNDNNADWHDSELSALYQKTSKEEPSQQLDQQILDDASKEAEKPLQKQVENNIKPFAPFSKHWGIPMSMAAILVLSVSVILTIDRETPEMISKEPAPLLVDELKIVTKDETPEQKLSTPGITPIETTTEDAAAAPDRPQRQLVKKDRGNVQNGAVAESDESLGLSTGFTSDLANDSARETQSSLRPAESDSQFKPQATRKKSEIEPIQRERRKDTQTGARLKKALPKTKQAKSNKQEVTDASNVSKTQHDKVSIDPVTKKTPAKAKPGAPKPAMQAAPSSMGIVADVASAPPLAEAEAVQELTHAPQAADSVSSPQESASESSPSGTFSRAPSANFSQSSKQKRLEKQRNTTGKQCLSLSQADCLASDTCILELDKADKTYVCRAASNHCELNFIQALADKKSCETKPNCTFTAAQCYCPPGVLCVCGGGPPASCSLQSN